MESYPANEFPGIFLGENMSNPTLYSSNSDFSISFFQTKDTLSDPEDYRSFLKNAIGRFRKSITYTNYKSYLMGLGLDRCQMLGNITSEMATVEMHHNIITIFDIALIISEHILNTYGQICTFDLAELIRQEHINNHIPLVFLSKTAHQLYHNTDELYISPSMTFGDWWSLLERYHTGITEGIAFKIIFYLNQAIHEGNEADDHNLFKLRDQLMYWMTDNIKFRYAV